MEFRVLGPLEVVDDGRRIALGGPKQRTVLALLVADAGRPVSADALVIGVYGDESSRGARKTLQTYISNLRAAIGDVIRFSADSYTLTIEPGQIDAVAFEEVVRACEDDETDPQEVSLAIREALAMWRGHPYADVEAHGRLAAERTRLSERRLEALAARIDADLAAGRDRELIAELESLTAEYPLREQFRAQHMLALYRSGRQADALRAYERTRTYLVEELGIDPSPELRQLEQQILEQDESIAFEVRPNISRAAVLVADVGDPEAFSALGPTERRDAMRWQGDILEDAIVTAGGTVFAHRGTAVYASFDTVAAGARAAGEAMRSLAAAGNGLDARIAIDAGDVEHDQAGGVVGPPVSRSAALVATAHAGQVLLTGAAHDEMTSRGGAGWMVLGLGSHAVPGIDGELAIHQLVVDGRPTSFPPLRTDTLPPPLPASATGVPGYEVREEVGSGAFGAVHRAYQPSVGREVAIKIIRPEFANDTEFIRRFEVEAQLVARLEHPHIVPLHDYWRGPDGGFLVMRWLDGGNLEDRLDEGASGREDATRLLAQIGPALDYAHRHGVVHRDVKPSNVLFDGEGNAYLTDFGIAAPSTGRDAVSDDCDALVSLLIALAGEDVIGLGPYPDVASVVTAWEAATGTGADARDLTYTATRNPYKGLRAFTELDAADFHGRDAQVAKLIDTLAENRLVAAVGPSGIGKSSVVRAGLIPALRQGALAGSETWLITDMVPGAYPHEELASALIRVASRMPTDIDAELRRDARGLVRVCRRYLPEDAELVIVIDQFEELFTLAPDDDRHAFLDLVTATADDARSPIRFVLTMRADYFDRPLLFSTLGASLRDATVPVSAPTEDDLRAMIGDPAADVGVRFEPGLVDRIVADVDDQPGALPLMEFTVTELFDQRDSDVLTSGAYEASGGVLGALGRRAEAIYQEFDDEHRETAGQVFLRLVNVAESGRDTRRRARISELERLVHRDTVLHAVLESFGDHRLVTFDRDATTRGSTVEVAHEAILTEWPRLRQWVDVHREDLLLHGRLATAVADWEAADRAEAYLLTGGRLTQHEAWTQDTEITLTTAEQELLTASRTAEDDRLARRRRTRWLVTAGFGVAAVIAAVLAIAALIAREDAAEQAELADASRLATAAVDVLDDDPELSLLLALHAAEQSGHTGFETRRALHAAIDRTRAIGRIEHRHPGAWTSRAWVSPDGSLVLAGGDNRAPLEVYELTDAGMSFLWAADEIPIELLTRAMFTHDGNRVLVWAVSPAVVDLSVGPPDDPSTQGLYLYDARSGELLARPDVPPCDGVYDYGFDRGFSPRSTGKSGHGSGVPLIAGWCLPGDNVFHQGSRSFSAKWWLMDASTGEVVSVHDDDRGVWWVTPTTGGNLVFIEHAGGAEILDLRTGTSHVVEVGSDHDALGPLLSPLGSFIIAGDRLFDPFTGGEVARLEVGPEGLEGCWLPTFSSDDSLVSFGCEDARLRVFSTATGEEVETLLGHSGWVDAGRLSASNEIVVSGSADGFVRAWDISDRAEVAHVQTGTGYHADAGIDIAGSMGVALVYPSETESPFDNQRSYMTRLAVGSLVVFDYRSGETLRRIDGVGGKVARISPDGSRVVAQAVDAGRLGELVVFDIASGDLLVGLSGLCPWVPPDGDQSHCGDDRIAADATDLAWRPDGLQVAMAGGLSRRLLVWDTSTGERVFVSDILGVEPLSAVAFSSDGSRLVVSSKSGMWVYDATTWELVQHRSQHQDARRPLIAHTGRPSWVMRFTSDGTQLVTAQAHSGDVRVYDTSTWEERSLQGGAAQTRDMALSRDESMVALADRDGNIHVLDFDTGDLLELVSLDDRDITNIEFIDDDTRLLISSSMGPIEILTLDPNELVDIARLRISRSFTTDECDFYRLDPCPTLTDMRAAD